MTQSMILFVLIAFFTGNDYDETRVYDDYDVSAIISQLFSIWCYSINRSIRSTDYRNIDYSRWLSGEE